MYPNLGGFCFGLRYNDGSTLTKRLWSNYTSIYINGKLLNTTIKNDRQVSSGNLNPDNIVSTKITPITMTEGTRLYLTECSKQEFSWKAEPKAEQYRFILFDKAGNVRTQEITQSTSVSIPVEFGEFQWKVESLKSTLISDSHVKQAIPENTIKFSVRNVNTDKNLKLIAEEKVAIIPPFKDTKMLVPNLGSTVDDAGWNMMTNETYSNTKGVQVNNLNIYGYDKRFYITMRCWAIVIEMINHHFNGNLTQDEITFFGNTLQTENPIFGAFRINEGNRAAPQTSAATLGWALNVNSKEPQSISSKEKWKEKIKEYLDDGRPVMFSIPGHMEMTDAMYENEEGKTILRILNGIGTNFKPKYEYLDDISFKHFYAYDKPTSVRMTDKDCPVDKDSDSDGIVDFDECYRFHTYYKDYTKDFDSDGDGIDDYHEIYASVRRVALSLNKEYNPNNEDSYIILDNYESMALLSKKLFPNGRPELTLDTDGDGNNDGEEDKNFNGIVDDGETDPYNPYDGKNTNNIYDVPEHFALYAMNILRFNDRANCISYEKFGQDKRCHVAAEGKKMNFSVNIGAGANVNDIYSKGQVVLRNRSSVGTVRIFKNDTDPFELDKAHDATYYQYEKQLNPKNWYWFVNINLPNYDVGNEDLIVKDGQVYTLKDGEKFRKVKVERGGILDAGEGEIYIGDLQMDAGSYLRKNNLDKGSVIHLNGDFIWNADIKLPVGNHPDKMAKVIKLIQHSNSPMYVNGVWAGTIYAPKSHLVLGQSKKIIYGRFLGYDVTVHQETMLYELFYRDDSKQALFKKKTEEAVSPVVSLAKESTKGIAIKAVTRGTISFETKAVSPTNVYIVKENGKVLKSFTVNPGQAGLNTINWDSEGLAKGMYFVTMHNNAGTCGKAFLLK